MPAGVLDRETRLVRELAEVHLPAVAGLAKHHDVRARAEDSLLQTGQDDGVNLGVLEPDALERVCELDVDAEIVRIQLEAVPGRQSGVLSNIQGQSRHRAIEGQRPVLVAFGAGVERDRGGIDAVVGHQQLNLNARSNYFRAVSTGESTPPDGGDRRRPGRRRRRAPGRRDAKATSSTRVDILKSAAAAFRRLGYHGATVEQIAAALHMKKGNLYYYFRNKEEILFACHQYSLDRLHELLDEMERSGLPPEQRL